MLSIQIKLAASLEPLFMINTMALPRLALWSLFFLFWVLSTFDDWLHYKIRNGTVFIGLIGTATLLYFFPTHILQWFYASLWGAIIGIALWRLQIWPAGDAKLFTLLCSMMIFFYPPGTYPSAHLFIAQITNTFIPAAIIFVSSYLLSILFNPELSIRSRFGNVAESFSLTHRLVPQEWRAKGGSIFALRIPLLVIIFGITAAEWAEGHFGIDALPVIVAALWFGTKLIRTFLTRGNSSKFKIISAYFVVFLFFGHEFHGRYSWSMVQDVLYALIEWLMLTIIFLVIDYYLEQIEFYPIPLSKLAPGMQVSKTCMKELAQKGLQEKSFGTFYPDGLTTPQTRLFKYWCRKNGVSKVSVYRTHPFAFWIFFGAWLTITIHGDLINIVMHGCLRR